MNAGTIALEGGAEFSPRCRDLDMAVVATAPFGPIVVLAGAARPGGDHDGAVARGVAALRRLVDDPVRGVPDPREDLDAALEVIDGAAMVVLPGGSPRLLLEVLALDGVSEALVRRWEDGATLAGSSAGAMVLAERTWVPDRDEVVDGLGLVPGLVLPHHDGASPRRLAGDEGLLRWGLPECGGVLVVDGSVRAVGLAGSVVARDRAAVPVPTSATPIRTLPGD